MSGFQILVYIKIHVRRATKISLLFQILKICIFKKKPTLMPPSPAVTLPAIYSDAGTQCFGKYCNSVSKEKVK